MKKILLVCSAGMSTSLLVSKMRNAAKEKGIEVEIDALPVAEASTVVDNVDIVLLGPQVRFQKGNVEKLVKGRIPVEVMDMRLYGMMNGKAILEDSLKKINYEKMLKKMSFIDKFKSAIERLLVPISTKFNAQRHICAVRDAFILSFPLTMAGSLMVLLNNVFLSADGFMYKILQFDKLFPGILKFQAVFAPVVKGSADIFSILIVFLIARNLAKLMEGDDLLTGLTAISVYFIIYPDYFDNEGVNYLTNQYLGAQGLFV